MSFLVEVQAPLVIQALLPDGILEVLAVVEATPLPAATPELEAMAETTAPVAVAVELLLTA